MMIDMLVKGADFSKLPQQKISSSKAVALPNKNFNEVLKEVKGTTEVVRETSVDKKTSIAPEKELKKNITSETEEEKVVEKEEINEKVIQQLQLLIIQLTDENNSPEEALEILKEITALFEEINPEALKGALLQLKETLDTVTSMDQISLENNTKLQMIKETLPVVLEELDAKIANTPNNEMSAVASDIPVVDKSQEKVQQQFQPIGQKLMPIEKLEDQRDVLIEKIDLAPPVKQERNLEGFEGEAISIEEVGNIPTTTDELPTALNSPRATQHLEATLENSLPEVDAKVLVQEVVSKIQILAQKGKSEMKIQLTPENLGTLHINISLEKGNITAKMFAENQQIKEMIDANLNQLKIALGDKGLNITKLEVAVGHNQEDFNRSQYYPQQQRNKLKIKRVSQTNLLGMEASTYLEEGVGGNPYVVDSKFNGLA